ncbi:MAG: DUF2460 domain-containing protein [Pontixanthobacter sp.]
MPFWLARERCGQDTDHIQRFDPRFWTVNFPRPMMASVAATRDDAMRVDCEFHHSGALCGLIWDSEDTLDHPLLAYDTNRDYARTTLRFRWRSQGLIPLDQPNGPTLTIEGRDASGAAATWYVRLWNYAEGTPEDARITLPFSQLESGYRLPGVAVHAHDIDRMFISFVPPGYVPNGDVAFDTVRRGHATIENIACTGHRPLLTIGDAMVPPHGEQMATAYDDAYNLTPQRLLRTIRGLGYRGRIVHYVGMSHFFALERHEDRLLVTTDGALCEPAERWHRAFLNECAALGYDSILSLSYELFAENCPAAWQQLAYDGEPGRTGWVPPSALLSPANTHAMGWLRAVAARFVALQRAAGLPVLFQIGEPWWWVTPDHKPCLYDAAALAAYFGILGGDPPVIVSVRETMDADQIALLDAAGAMLSASTAALTQAVRDAAGSGPAEVLLLAFTPSILDPLSPELKRANVPVGWAHPAFDRLQLEDYDWLTAGADANRRAAYAEFDARLGYPIERQDYLSGFVLRAQDADAYWRHIDAGLDEAAARGVTQRFVWALPQISRDGYTRLAPHKEDTDMQAFDDVSYPLALARDVGVSPEFSTSVAVTASGHEQRNTLWSDARLHYDVGPGVRAESELAVLIAFFRARRGAARGFRLTDPFDFSSNGMTGVPRASDQTIGTGDGATATFSLVKHYGTGDDPQIRRITRPRVDTVAVSVNGATVTDWRYLTRGRIALGAPPPPGADIRAGFLFDVPVRFAQDRLDVTGVNFAAGEAPSVPLIEVRESE